MAADDALDRSRRTSGAGGRHRRRRADHRLDVSTGNVLNEYTGSETAGVNGLAASRLPDGRLVVVWPATTTESIAGTSAPGSLCRTGMPWSPTNTGRPRYTVGCSPRRDRIAV